MSFLPKFSLVSKPWMPLLLVVASMRLPLHAQESVPEFQAACTRLATGDNTYFSNALLLDLEKRLASASEPLTGPPLEENLGYRGVLGRELLKQARPEEAAALLESALERVRGLASVSEGLEPAIHWHLALAQLQLAEDQNCVTHRTAASCILPIRKGGVHQAPERARKATQLLRDYTTKHPRNVQAAWLLNLAARLSGDFPSAVPEPFRLPESHLSDESFPMWRDRAPELGLNVVDLAGGAVMDDFDGDGLLDLISSTWDPCDGLKAFRNTGKGRF